MFVSEKKISALTLYRGVEYIIFVSEKSIEKLLNNVIGQLNGINKMILDNRDCVDVLGQMKAASSALSSLMSKYVAENATSCIADLAPKQKDTLSKLIKELSKS